MVENGSFRGKDTGATSSCTCWACPVQPARPGFLPPVLSLEHRAFLWGDPGLGTSPWGAIQTPGPCLLEASDPRPPMSPDRQVAPSSGQTPLWREPLSPVLITMMKNQVMRGLRSDSYKSPNASVFLLECSLSRFCLTKRITGRQRTRSPEVSCLQGCFFG